MRLWSLLLLLLAACQPSPAYFVNVTRGASSGHCGGFAINESEVVTPDHCTKYGFDRVIKQNGEPVTFTVAERWPDVDLALLRTSEPLDLDYYATFEESKVGDLVDFFGLCDLVPVNRSAIRIQDYTWMGRPYCTTWGVVVFSCKGDSGGPLILSNGSVAGMQVAVWDWGINNDRVLRGSAVCVVPASVIQERLDAGKEEVAQR